MNQSHAEGKKAYNEEHNEKNPLDSIAIYKESCRNANNKTASSGKTKDGIGQSRVHSPLLDKKQGDHIVDAHKGCRGSNPEDDHDPEFPSTQQV